MPSRHRQRRTHQALPGAHLHAPAGYLKLAGYRLAFVAGYVPTPITHLVSFEVSAIDTLRWVGFLAAAGHRARVAVLWMEGVVHVAMKVGRTMKPLAGADEYAPGKPLRTVVACGSAAIRGDVVVTVRTIGCHPNIDAYLSLGFGDRGGEASSRNRRQHQTFESIHNFTSL